MSVSSSLAGTPDNRMKRADGINWAWRNGASVISNSWSSSVKYQVIDDAVALAQTNGRSGKGCVVVFASGNDYSSTVSYPANANSDILAVGANDRSGKKSGFSNYGTALDVVGPGEGIYSTTTGSSYVSSISGTSFACPYAAGVVALVLSVNPNLTQKEAVVIIEKTAKKLSKYIYVSTSGRPNGTWNNETGYGMLDAYTAVLAASTGGDCVTTYLTPQTITSNKTITGCDIQTEKITVSNSAKLTLIPRRNTTILTTFIINAGSQFEISKPTLNSTGFYAPSSDIIELINTL